MSDQYLADALFTYETFDTSGIRIERHLLSDSELEDMDGYRRYEITESGVSPRALPGQAGVLVVADSDEHNEEGHIDQTIENRIKMNEKRLRKLETLKEDMQMPVIRGPDGANLSLIGWGSTFGPLAEAVDRLNDEGISINLIHFSDIYPLPEKDVRVLLDGLNETVCVENNATGQFAQLLRTETGFEASDRILRYDGLPFTPKSIIRELKMKEVI
jgi:2-oxoglutarate ferredoxin oxidoreductase subunit alpha